MYVCMCVCMCVGVLSSMVQGLFSMMEATLRRAFYVCVHDMQVCSYIHTHNIHKNTRNMLMLTLGWFPNIYCICIHTHIHTCMYMYTHAHTYHTWKHNGMHMLTLGWCPAPRICIYYMYIYTHIHAYNNHGMHMLTLGWCPSPPTDSEAPVCAPDPASCMCMYVCMYVCV